MMFFSTFSSNRICGQTFLQLNEGDIITYDW